MPAIPHSFRGAGKALPLGGWSNRMNRGEVARQFQFILDDCKYDRDGDRIMQRLEDYIEQVLPSERESVVSNLRFWLSKRSPAETNYAVTLANMFRLTDLRPDLNILMREWMDSLRQPYLGFAVDYAEESHVTELLSDLDRTRIALQLQADSFRDDSIDRNWRLRMVARIVGVTDKLRRGPAT